MAELGARRRNCSVLVAICALLLPGASGAEEDLAELKAIVEEQSEQIRELQDQVRQLEDEAEAPVPKQVVETIDQRIVDFENHASSKLFISGYGAGGYTDPEVGDTWTGPVSVDTKLSV